MFFDFRSLLGSCDDSSLSELNGLLSRGEMDWVQVVSFCPLVYSPKGVYVNGYFSRS